MDAIAAQVAARRIISGHPYTPEDADAVARRLIDLEEELVEMGAELRRVEAARKFSQLAAQAAENRRRIT